MSSHLTRDGAVAHAGQLTGYHRLLWQHHLVTDLNNTNHMLQDPCSHVKSFMLRLSFAEYMPAGSEAWIMSLGPLVAPAGSTLLLQVTYRAGFGARQGLWRSSPYPSAAAPGQQAVALSTELEMNAARTLLPCLDEPRYKVSKGPLMHWCVGHLLNRGLWHMQQVPLSCRRAFQQYQRACFRFQLLQP